MVKPDGYLERIYDELQRRREEESGSWKDGRDRLLEKLKQALGEFEYSPGGGEPFEPVLLERVELEEAVRERVEFATFGGLRMPAYVMIPKALKPGERAPGVLLWHGHGYGSRSVVGLQEDGSPRPATGKLSDNIALELARRGLVVIAPEVVGFGDRKLERDLVKEPTIGNSCYNLSVSLLMTGRTTAGLRAYEAMRAADYLASRPEVDAERLGNIGHSGGGTVASLSAALDSRIKASVVGIYGNTYRGSILAMRHCLCNYIPGILQHAEMPDLLGLIAPRALFIEAGIGDPIFPANTAREAVRQLKEIYAEMEAADRFESDFFEGKHEVSGRKSFEWLAAALKGGPS
ncbi:dienelactone hydrolase family protein [Paenibacillus ginsengihumi]|uniref:dienelactone hydrolase family protein n=1 Tax=Paenibacillus ginsengihumi TaxID=431596 RepID=UPI000366DD54|nr:alpha/beta hydrolase family protein [Paenibacillus ginsengihumi]